MRRRLLWFEMLPQNLGTFAMTSCYTAFLLIVLGPSVLLRVGGSVVKFENSVALDYVSLSGSQARLVGGDSENEANATNWVVGGVTECSKLPAGCSCLNNRASKLSSVICTCRDPNEVVNLNEAGFLRRQFESLTWEIKGCSKVVVKQNFLSAIFNSGNKLKLYLKFSDVPNLVIHEAAFTVTDSGSFSHETTVEFNNCDIATVPPKAFPSYLSLLKFDNCRIGTLSSRFIQSLKIDIISIVGSTILDVQPDAFYQRAMINSLLAHNSTFKQIQRDAVASGIQHLNWTGCTIGSVEEHGISGLIANVYLEQCTLSNIKSQGFYVKTWSVMNFVNNSFNKVSHRGIDLTQLGTNGGETSAYLVGNSWGEVTKDFVVTGMGELPFVTVKNNTFLQACTCGSTFVSVLSLNESKSWFLDELLESSQCPLEEKDKGCFISENGTMDGYVSYSELHILCSSDMYMCTSDVNEMHVNPKLPNRLQLLAFFIGAFVLFMVVSLLLTLMVYMIRKQRPRKQDNGGDLANDIPRKEFVRSLNPDGPYGPPVPPNSKMTKTPSMPSRIALLEDVEMEDKGVQTLPTELSADIIEGLREKLSKPDSFWDAKETIDHLYDLIHVRDQVPISSPPDVTCNDNRGGSDGLEPSVRNTNTASTDSLKPLVTPRRNIKVQQPVPVDRSSQRRSMSTFAQLTPSPTKTVGVGPSNSNSHIYSELSAVQRERRNLAATSPTTSSPPPLPTSSPPRLCDYTDPRDFQTHIYAELMCAAARNPDLSPYSARQQLSTNSSDNNPVIFGDNYESQAHPTTSSVILNNSPQHTNNLNGLNFEDDNSSCSVTTTTGPSCHSPSRGPNNLPPDSSNVAGNSSQNKRPLPSIPPKPVSSTSQK